MSNRCHVVMLLFFVYFTSVTQAKILRVGYGGPQVAGVDYINFQLAHDAALSGDTLMFYSGNFSGNATKPLLYRGYGYFLSGDFVNPGMQAVISGPLSLEINLNTGSGGSQFEGIGNEGSLTLTITAPVDDIVIRRCHTPSVYSDTDLDCANWRIMQSHMVSFAPNLNHSGTGRFIDMSIENSTISGYILTGLQPGSTGQLINCIVSGGAYLENNEFTISNSVFLPVLEGIAETTFNNNIFLTSSNEPGSITNGSNNIFYGFFESVFRRLWGGTTDLFWTLIQNSPAFGAGIDGVDCGIFGGPEPYVISGIPPVPVFYGLSSPQGPVTTNPFIINFSIKSNH